MKKLVYVALATTMFACSQAPKEGEQTGENMVANAQAATFGEAIDTTGAVALPEFIKNLGTQDSVQVKLAASIEEVCQKKGCWMKLDKGDGSTMRVSFKDYAFFVPKDASGKKAYIDGMAYYQVTTVEELRHYAHDAGKSKEEIEAIKEPSRELVFEAKGVVIQ
jgi:hypothetical protein